MRRPLMLYVIICLLPALLIVQCGDDDSSHEQPSDDTAVVSQAGFISIDNVSYSFLNSSNEVQTLSPEPARIFYSFQKADDTNSDIKAVDLPVLVLFNGGPGAATSVNFMSLNTADITLCKAVTGEELYKTNPYSWRNMANILYIDAPWTGFSYNYGYQLPCFEAFVGLVNANTFNPFVDADLMVRALLQIMKKCHVQKNEAVIVGESYGGTRATVMLNMLLFPDNYHGTPDTNHLFKDNALVDEIRAHHLAVLGTEDLTPKEIAAKQFGKTVLVQPQLTGEYYNLEAGDLFSEEDSIIDALWKEQNLENVGKWDRSGARGSERSMSAITYVRDKLLLDPYFVEKESKFTDKMEYHATRGLLRADVLAKVLNLSGPEAIKNIPEFLPETRSQAGAYNKCVSSSCDDLAALIQKLFGEEPVPAPVAVRIDEDDDLVYDLPPIEDATYDLRKYLGSTSGWCDEYFKPWDIMLCFIYYIDSIDSIFTKPIGRRWARKMHPDSVMYGEMFLHNLAVMDVMITNADEDLMIYSPAVPPSLAHYGEIVTKVDPDDENSTFVVHYKEGFPSTIDSENTDNTRTVYHPKYEHCGHAVSTAKPEKLRNDVASFLGLQILP